MFVSLSAVINIPINLHLIDPDWLLRVKTIIEWAKEEDFIVVLNAHGEHWFLEACGKREEFYSHEKRQ